MFDIALLNKTENIGLASNALHLMLIFVTTPIFLYKERLFLLFLYFRRSYKGTFGQDAEIEKGPIFRV